jgi:acyl carrier protein
MHEDIKQQLKPLILKSLRITDMAPADLKDDQKLMGGDLEIDSIDVLQLVLEIEKHFGIKLVTGKFDPEVWTDINSLAATIEAKVSVAGQR